MTALFLLGLLGSGHCLGMCGPLVLAFPGRVGTFRAHLAYHFGRITTYTILGTIIAGLGTGLTHAAGAAGADVAVARVQVLVSLPAAGFLFLFGLIRLKFCGEPRWLSGLSPLHIPGAKTAIQQAVKTKNPLFMVLTGLCLGLLPCGLSYAAFARALAADSILQGTLMTLVFGLGTLPVLLTLGAGAAQFVRKYRSQFDLVAGLLMLGMAASLAFDALRGVL